ncbi:hypothetical protein EDB19DRAFT_1906977 [Suillus lakei]|nr:hypothetical protein EDB19DRAFT_1906977 [Suillus lakei]
MGVVSHGHQSQLLQSVYCLPLPLVKHCQLAKHRELLDHLEHAAVPPEISGHLKDFSMDIDASMDSHLPDFVPAELVIAAMSSHILPASQDSHITSTPSVILPSCPPPAAMTLSLSQQAPLPMQSDDRQLTLPEPLIQSLPKMRRGMMSMQPTIALDAESNFVAACDARPASPVCKMTEQHDLSLYDDPEDFDDIHNDPLSHNSAFDGDEDKGVDIIVPPAGIQVPHDEDTSVNHEHPTSYPPPRPLRDIYLGCHETWWAWVIIALVAFLHTKHQLSFRGCVLLLFCLNTIFMTLALLPSTQNLPLTLNTVIHRLNLDDQFTIHPIATPNYLSLSRITCSNG